MKALLHPLALMNRSHTLKTIGLLIISLALCQSVFGQNDWKPDYYNRIIQQNYASFAAFSEPIDPDRFDAARLNAAMFFETNRQRILHNLKPLLHHRLIEQCAQEHSNDMVYFNFYSHTNPTPGRHKVWERMTNAGLRLSMMAENIQINCVLDFRAEYYHKPSDVGCFMSVTGRKIEYLTYLNLAQNLLTSWMESPGHRQNILTPDFTHFGAGSAIYFEDEGVNRIAMVKCTQNFWKESATDRLFVNGSTLDGKRVVPSARMSELEEKYAFKQFSVMAGANSVFNSFEDIGQLEMEYQGVLHVGMNRWRGGLAPTFLGLFVTVDFVENTPLSLEVGTIWRRILRLSAGVRYEAFSERTFHSQATFVPSLTTGLRFNMGDLFLDANVNLYGMETQLQTRLVAGLGFRF